jgi:hypothetical protein
MGAGSSTPAEASLLSVFDAIGDFASLGLPASFALSALRAFVHYGGGAEREVSPAALFSCLVMPEELRPRLFSAFDRDGSGGLSFKEFTLGLVEFCSLDARALLHFAWSLFAAPGGGMAPSGLHALCRVAYGGKYAQSATHAALLARAELMAEEACARGGARELSLEQWLSLIRDRPSLLQPVFGVQVQLRGAVLGEAMWRSVAAARGVGTAGGGAFAWPALEAIRERLAGRGAAGAAEGTEDMEGRGGEGAAAAGAAERAPPLRRRRAAPPPAACPAEAARVLPKFPLTAVEAGFIAATRGQRAALERAELELREIRGRARGGGDCGARERGALVGVRQEASENVVRANALLKRAVMRNGVSGGRFFNEQ